MKRIILYASTLMLCPVVFGQGAPEIRSEEWSSDPGIIGTMILLSIVLIIPIVIITSRISRRLEHRRIIALKSQNDTTNRKEGDQNAIIKEVELDPEAPFADLKKKNVSKMELPNDLKHVIYMYLSASIFWLLFGTFIGQYLGMKFVWPELDGVSWLSFGRLRPVHTNTVFWGWASLAMIGLGYFVLYRTNQVKNIFSIKLAKLSWLLINASIIVGNCALMAGINNGGAEYREYIWPIAAIFALGLLLTFRNYYKTIAMRKTKEIYVSNWYMMGALIWTIILVTIGYLPTIQDGLGETVVQGYYMHQGVGMWFMTFTLGLVYYYLPSALNKPIYSYSLGALAFWTQMLFYTLIGTHHFVFSPLPWWLQTIAIVFSAGMLVPVIAGTTNFLMTFRGSFRQISKSYVLPFFIVGIVFYFIGSAQGTFQAFRFTNYVWHFTDFNVAHSHMTMYGIISFFLWGATYALMPKITGKEPRQIAIGLHFWLAFIGLSAYMFSMMIGGTLKGMSWLDGETFIESVQLMAPYWLWRAIGGTLMFVSHIVFAVNFYRIWKQNKSKTA